MDIGPLLLAEAHNLSGLEVAVIEQIGQALLALAWQYPLEDFPQLEARGTIFKANRPTTWVTHIVSNACNKICS